MVKNRMVKEGLTISQIREEGLLSEELINTLMKKDVIPRNRTGTEYHYSSKYMEYVAEWYDQIIPIIKNNTHVIGTHCFLFMPIQSALSNICFSILFLAKSGL